MVIKMVNNSETLSLNAIQRNRASLFMEKSFKYWMIIPITLALLAIAIFPFLYALYLSFTNAKTINFLHPNFVWFKNYWFLLKNGIFYLALAQTLGYVALSLGLETGIGLFLAILADKVDKGSKVIVSLLFTPMLISTVFAGIIAKLVLSPTFGVIQYYFNKIGFAGELTDKAHALITIIGIDVWQWTSFMFLILYAGLKALPPEPFEAARVFKANAWQTFRYITLPLLKPVLIIAAIFRMMDSFKAFDHIYALTGGGPGNATATLSVLMYNFAYKADSFGIASALGIVMLVVVIFATKRLLRFMPMYK
ncbi:MAG: sugar ABC transporter permease [Actinobacteria bacterium]|nr:sugar ABC transporter permease [Actinomycetota bacterium]